MSNERYLACRIKQRKVFRCPYVDSMHMPQLLGVHEGRGGGWMGGEGEGTGSPLRHICPVRPGVSVQAEFQQQGG